MSGIRKIFGLLTIPFLFTGVFAVSASVVYAPDVVSIREAQQEPLTFKILVNPENVTMDYAQLTLTIVDADENLIYCRASKNIENLGEETLYTFKIYPDTCYRALQDGVYNAIVELVGYYDNQTFNLRIEKKFSIKDALKNTDYDLDIVSVYPVFDQMKEISAGTYVIRVTVRNSGLYDLEGVMTKLYVLDEYGNLVYKRESTRYDIDAGSERTYDLVLDASNFEVGKTYQIVIETEDAYGYAKEEKTYTVKVIPGKVGEISLVDLFIRPFQIYPGDYVEVAFYLRNNLQRKIKVTPIVISQDLGIYKELDEVEFEPDELKKVVTVLKIPDYIERGAYKVTLRLEAGDLAKQYDIYLDVIGEEKQLLLEVSEPAAIKVGADNTFVLTLRSLKEKLWDLNIEAYYDEGKVSLERNEIVFGGKGETYSVKLTVRPKEAGTGKLVIILRDANTGEEILRKEISIEATGGEYIKFTEKIKEYLPYIIGFIVAIVAVIMFWLVYGKEEEERPSR